MVEQAETKGCDALVLDTGLKNPARRLYDAFGLDASAVHYIGALAELSADHPAGDPSAASG